MCRIIWFLIALFVFTACESQVQNSTKKKLGNQANKFAIATAHPLATQAGINILHQGGNAFDAAVAVTAVLAVVEPYASGLGGGGFWLLHLAEENHNVMVDGREVAPLAATRDMYIDENGKPTNQSVSGPLAAGIPGTPAAIAHIAENYARLSLEQLLQPAIRLAEDGFEVSSFYTKRAEAVSKRLNKFPHSASIYLKNGQAPKPGFKLRQTELAGVLKNLAASGAAGFYRGEVAEQLVRAVQEAGGIWQIDDLHNYAVVERQAVTGKYKNLKIVSAALPSSGGIVLMQVLNMLDGLDLQTMDEDQRRHVIIEAMRRAYHDRSVFLGDVDYVEVEVEELLSKPYALDKMADLNQLQATSSQSLIRSSAVMEQSINEQAQNTTHFSILDQYGNRVAATLSINYFFGSGFVAQGTGVLLNNEMDDFSIQPGHANLWGLVGSEANSIQPGKRMLSSMTPTFLDDGERMAILGTPGGSRIISMVLLSTLAFMQGASAEQLVAQPRFHHQFLPDSVQHEPDAFSPQSIAYLTSLGHELKDLQRQYGNMQVVLQDYATSKVTAASDPRGIGMSYVQ